MEEKKRKSYTSTDVKRRHNEKVYTQISFSVPKEIAKAFKVKCKADGISQAQVLKTAINNFLEQ